MLGLAERPVTTAKAGGRERQPLHYQEGQGEHDPGQERCKGHGSD
jgi:hypothetical protein